MTPTKPSDLIASDKNQNKQAVIAVVGNPNTGKSTLFNLLTGMRQKVANYPGVTVEKRIGELTIGERRFQLIDLPGTYSLAAHSPDERAAIDVLLGRIGDMPAPDAVLVVVDATNIKRNLFVATEVLELGIPVVIALNMVDIAESQHISIDVAALATRLNTVVIPTIAAATRHENLEPLKAALATAVDKTSPKPWALLEDVKQAAAALATELATECAAQTPPSPQQPAAYEVQRALIDKGGEAEKRLVDIFGSNLSRRLQLLRDKLTSGQTLAERDANERYAYIAKILDGIVQVPAGNQQRSLTERIDQIVSHPIIGSLLFVLVMATVFQAVFSWATPLMDLIDGTAGWVTDQVYATLPEGAIASLLADGVVAGVGSVVIFLPQILILFAFIIVLEDSGYMARAAFLMDRSMRWCGLSGHSFVPMLSSFACAVPAIMGTRVIPDTRDRIATIMAAPFMTCSARLPVYALLIAAFIPRQHYFYGLVNLQGLVLLGLYLLGIVGGVLTAFLLKRTILRGSAPTFLMELPPYRTPNIKSVLVRLIERAKAFLVRAGTVIFFVSVVVWSLAYFPRSEILAAEFERQKLAVEASVQIEAAREQAILVLENELAAAQMEQSLLGRMGKTIAPVFKPLGWDWKLSAAVIASFPAREVVIAVLGTTYAVGSDVDEEDEGLRERVRNAAWPDGKKVFTPGIALGLMVFYALCLQCAATVVIIYRETNSWRWPAFAWVYMTGLGYLGALACAQLG
ncbi:MAG: ferrous iron transport protein B [Gammaproteobacteria bacterium]|nr:ferrous iron transport protein B [Gammaproteobacteria bacterium]MBQ0839356.1 ferrous iron transport protein B [Gammaproteobacteria bacterium]